MTEKEQFKTYLPPDVADHVRTLEGPNTEIVANALEMYLRAHGEGTTDSLRREVREIDGEIADIRESATREIDRIWKEAMADIAARQERRDELTELIERKERKEQSYRDILGTIVDGLAANPSQNIEAYRTEVGKLVDRGGPGHSRDDVIQAIRERADQEGYAIAPDRLGVSQPEPVIAADGGGDSEEPVDTSRYEFGGGSDE